MYLVRKRLTFAYDDITSNPDIDSLNAMRVYWCLKGDFDISILNIPGDKVLSRTPPRNIINLFRRALIGNNFALMRALMYEKGVVYVSRVPFILASLIYRICFHLNYKVVAVIYGGPNSNNKIQKLVFRILIIPIIRLADGLVYDKVTKVAPLVERFAKQKINIPSVLVDSDLQQPTKIVKNALLVSLGISGKKLVGIIGPFYSFNEPSIAYVQAHIQQFSNDIAFLMIGRYDKKKYKSNDRIIFLDYVEDFDGYLAMLDCVLIPRLITTGSPMTKMVRAMACSVPVVTNELEGMKARPGEEVLLGTLEELPNLVNKLVCDKEKSNELGTKGKMFIDKYYLAKPSMERLRHFLQARTISGKN